MSKKYVALDVHSATTSMCCRDHAGRVTMETVVQTKTGDLLSMVRGISGEVHLTFEEGPQASWLHDLLRPQVAELIVCDPRRNRLLEDGSKSDRIDARKLSELLYLGKLKAVYHGEHGAKDLKELVKSHGDLVRDTVRVKNRLKNLFRSRGISVCGAAVYQQKNRQEWIAKLTGKGIRRRTELLYEQLSMLEELRGKAEREMIVESRRHAAGAILRGIPGIGPIRAAQLLGHVGTPHRFRTNRQFWKYVGLSVVQRTSSDFVVVPSGIVRRERHSTRGLTHQYNRCLKSVFKAAALDAIRGDFAGEYQRRVDAGIKPEMVRLTIARKLATISLMLWKKGERYDSEKALKRAA